MQKMRNHVVATTIVFIILMLLFKKVTITLMILAIPYTAIPDIEAGTKYHRNFMAHGTLLWLMVMAYFWAVASPLFLLSVLINLSVGMHLLFDITPHKEDWKGMYCVKYWTSGMNGVNSTLWLLGNFIVSLVLFLIVMFI